MSQNMTDTIISRCEAKGLRMTGQRRIIATVLQDSDDHPDVEELYARAAALDADDRACRAQTACHLTSRKS